MRKRLQQQSRNKVRVSDVARLARCSTATVSRVQNSPHLVSAETRSRVHAAIRELGYMPNSAARALRSHRSRMIGTVIPTLNYAIFASFVEAVQRHLTAGGYSLLVATSEYDLDHEAEQASLLIERGAEGLILVGAQHRPALYRMMESAGVPYINAYVYQPDGPHPCVGIDNERAMSDIAEFLYSLGHRRFGVISGATAENDRAAGRIRGIREALSRHGIMLPQDAVVERPFSIANGREGLRTLVARKPPPTAVICGNDILAFGALIECRELGLAVPQQISVVGFDDLDFAPQISPPLTTMEMPATQMGSSAATFLLDTLAGRPTPLKMQLEPKLIARRTTGGVPAR